MLTLHHETPPANPCDWPDHYEDEAPEMLDDFDPSEEDAQWWASHTVGGCDPAELSPDEVAMLAGTLSASDFAAELLDPGPEPEPTPEYCLF